jgi:anti-sigma regulatory factor (Ser/Thr protein kinase)
MAKTNFYDAVILELDPCQDTSSFSIPKIFVSENQDPAFVLKIFEAHAFAFLPLPLEIAKWNKITELLAEKKTKNIEIISAAPHWIELNIPAQPFYFYRVLSFLEPVFVFLFPSDNNKILIAFRELVQNAMEHGSAFSEEKMIFIRCLKSQKFFLIEIQDQGSGFNPESLPHAAIGCSGKDAVKKAMRYRKEKGMRPGGLGISYSTKAMDELIYNQRGNAVTIVKYFENFFQQLTKV